MRHAVAVLLQQVLEFTRRGVEEHKGNYNIWYGKYENIEGHRSYDRGKHGTNPETRCVVATDVGKTKGDTQPSSLLCYLFAQGRCHHGPECNFLHRIPDEEFDVSLEHARDCFGRLVSFLPKSFHALAPQNNALRVLGNFKNKIYLKNNILSKANKTLL